MNSFNAESVALSVPLSESGMLQEIPTVMCSQMDGEKMSPRVMPSSFGFFSLPSLS